MRIVKPLLFQRRKNHVETRLQLRDERAFFTRLWPWIALIFISFAFVDDFSTNTRSFWYFFALRTAAVLLSAALFLVTRARCRYGLRIFFTVAPYMYLIEYIMFTEQLSLTPYFSGLALVLFTSTTLFPMRARISAFVYAGTILPAIVYILLNPFPNVAHTVTFVMMAGGLVMLGAINSEQSIKDYIQRLMAREALARDLGRREQEVRKKSEELLRRRTFESQFSPQVVSAVLNNPSSVLQMQQKDVAVIVFDIENSTIKANTLSPAKYKEVVEEVFDVFGSACLKWNVTVDKFTGDGAQALVGAPLEMPDLLPRAMSACRETIEMIGARREHLDLLWGSPLNIRFAVCEGTALIGFFGRGTLKSFTAIGETVSFTHRLCSAGAPWRVFLYSWKRPIQAETGQFAGWQCQEQLVSNLKGFGNKQFVALNCLPEQNVSANTDIGRCASCHTPLVLNDGPSGLPQISCPGCESRGTAKAA